MPARPRSAPPIYRQVMLSPLRRGLVYWRFNIQSLLTSARRGPASSRVMRGYRRLRVTRLSAGSADTPHGLGFRATSSPSGTHRKSSPTWQPSTWQSRPRTVTSSLISLLFAKFDNVRGVIAVRRAQGLKGQIPFGHANFQGRFDHRVTSDRHGMQEPEISIQHMFAWILDYACLRHIYQK